MVLQLSTALEHRVRRNLMYGMMLMGALGVSALAAVNRTETAVKVAVVGFIVLCVCCNVVISTCAKLLLGIIDSSLQRSVANKTEQAGNTSAKVLMTARKKVKLAWIVCTQQASFCVPMFTFSVTSKFGTAVPLLLFGVPMSMSPLLWFTLNIQLHAGRSKPDAPKDAHSVAARGNKSHTPLNKDNKSQISQVVPTEAA